MANNVFAPNNFLSQICSTTAQAILKPSKVLVPRPISSKIRRLLAVAFLSIFATSVISTINVLWPLAKSSDAPTLVKILSHIDIFAYFAGTKEPIWAISTINAVWRIYVDFPAMLGPVIIASLLLFMSRNVLLAINVLSGIIFSTTGCLPSLISITPFSFILGLT